MKPPGPPGSVQLTSILKTPLAETGVLDEQNSVAGNCARAPDAGIDIKPSAKTIVISLLISMFTSRAAAQLRTMRVVRILLAPVCRCHCEVLFAVAATVGGHEKNHLS